MWPAFSALISMPSTETLRFRSIAEKLEIRSVTGSITIVTPDAATNSPSSQATLSPRAGLSLRNRLQPLNRVQVQENVALRFPVHDLRNRTDDRRTENHRFRLCQPDSWWLVRDNREQSLVAKIAVNHRQHSLPHEPLQHVKNCRIY